MGDVVTTKACSACRAVKALSAFTPRPDRNGSPRAKCRECEAARKRSRYMADEKMRYVHRVASRKYRHRVSLEKFNALFAAQKGCCGICQRHQSESPKTFAVDHDHATGEIRGLLCNECNLFLGLAHDDPAVLAAAISYLAQKGEH